MGAYNDVNEWIVLIVEDDPDNLGVSADILSFFGAKVHTAENGAKGLDILDTILPTFILLDLSMPGMDGWRMLESLRANPETAPIPVIALTAHAMHGDRDRAMAAGFDGYIPKPIQVSAFIDQIKAVLTR